MATILPIDRLPAEVFALILEEYARSFAHRMLSSPRSSAKNEQDRVLKKYLRILTQVCPRWAQAIFSTPALWATICVNTDVWAQCSLGPAVLLDVVKASLKHSRNYRLTLRIAAETDDPFAIQLLQLMAQHSARWHDVHLRIAPQHLHILRPIGGKVPMLRHLSISGDSAPLTALIDVLPKLQSLFFEGPLPPDLTLQLPWTALSRLVHIGSAEDMAPLKPLVCLQALPPRSSADIHICTYYRQVVTPQGAIHSNVGSLALIVYTSRRRQRPEPGRIFDALTLRRLRTLQWTGLAIAGRPVPVWPHAAYLRFADRSHLAERLTVLTIHAYITEDELLEVLGDLRVLQRLDIADVVSVSERHPSCAVITDRLLERLTGMRLPPTESESDSPNHAHALVPRLHTAILRTTLLFCSDEALSDFMLSRTGASFGEGSPVRAFRMKLVLVQMPEDEWQMRMLGFPFMKTMEALIELGDGLVGFECVAADE
ncbi:hypothetical protein C8F01DRAFT_769454 [Mycena amicta]|nr:hypothetical protein C8F01DRAFT_769454 [Mycena amicta]